MNPKPYSGGCLCGAIRFRATGAPGKPHTCSCASCRRHSGALTLGGVEFPSDAVEWTGPGGRPSVWRSSPHPSRAFCSVCGSTLGAIDDAAAILQRAAIGKILTHLGLDPRPPPRGRASEAGHAFAAG
jgi:hypothetical protein